jgi:hypothetical protein
LLDVDSWTGLTDCFTHQRNGRAADNKPALLSSILADGINLGLNRMADAIRGRSPSDRGSRLRGLLLVPKFAKENPEELLLRARALFKVV